MSLWVEITLRVLAVSTVGCLLLAATRGWSAALRHRTALLALLISTILVPAAALLPGVEVAVLPAEEVAGPAALTALEPLEEGAAWTPASWNDAAATPPPIESAPAAAPFASLLPGWAVVWLLGAVLLLLRAAWGQISLGLLARQLPTIEARAWNDLVTGLKRRVGLRGRVRLVSVDAVVSPAAFGIARPSIMLPRGAAAWRGVGLSQVLLHELAHLRRRDPLLRLMAELCRAAFWFLPTVWLLERSVRIEGERACDDLVLRSGASASGYATVLLRLHQRLRTERGLVGALACFVRGSQIQGRLNAILDPRPESGRGLGPTVLVSGAAAAAAVLAVVEPVRAQAESPVVASVEETAPLLRPRVLGSAPSPVASEAPRVLESVPAAVVVVSEPLIVEVPASTEREVAVPLQAAEEEGPASVEIPAESDDVEAELVRALAPVIRSIEAGELPRGTSQRTPFNVEMRVMTLDELRSGKGEGRDLAELLDRAGVDLDAVVNESLARARRTEAPPRTRASVPRSGNVELLARERHRDHLRATYSFEHATRDDRAATLNDWDLQLRGHRAPYEFDVDMTGGDRSRIADLGELTLAEVSFAPEHVARLTRDRVEAHAGHAYLVHTLDRNSDHWTAFRVLEMSEDGRCRIEWRMLAEDDPPPARSR